MNTIRLLILNASHIIRHNTDRMPELFLDKKMQILLIIIKSDMGLKHWTVLPWTYVFLLVDL